MGRPSMQESEGEERGKTMMTMIERREGRQ